MNWATSERRRCNFCSRWSGEMNTSECMCEQFSVRRKRQTETRQSKRDKDSVWCRKNRQSLQASVSKQICRSFFFFFSNLQMFQRLKSQVCVSVWCLCDCRAVSQSHPLVFNTNFDSNLESSSCNHLTLWKRTLQRGWPHCVGFGRDAGRDLCPLWWCVRPSVGVIAIIVCITVAVLLADVPAAWRWGVFSAGRVGRHPPLLVVPHATLKQARVCRVCWFHRRRFQPGVLSHYPCSVFGLFLQQGRLQWLEERGRVQPGVAGWHRRRWGGRRGWYGSKPAQTGARFTWVAEVLRGRPAGAPACWVGSWYRHASRCKRMVWVVAEGMMSGSLQGKGLVETISGEVPIIGGSELKPIRCNTLLRW